MKTLPAHGSSRSADDGRNGRRPDHRAAGGGHAAASGARAFKHAGRMCAATAHILVPDSAYLRFMAAFGTAVSDID
ncbi:hypothetical protein [Burkholderia contaminans]|uniref:Aldehyde dehydrogenase n=1 Tax=Burkholderia contaminans TaxID=488447 RepID=A0A6P3AVD2_9BURK|nr:hypothetical protein [Burkholderia contaminans]VWD51451.1 aldehyde dehydrogenase [Burkholderia contaminans]